MYTFRLVLFKLISIFKAEKLVNSEPVVHHVFVVKLDKIGSNIVMSLLYSGQYVPTSGLTTFNNF